MTRSILKAVNCTFLAAIFTLGAGAPTAFAASDGNAASSAHQPVASSTNAWTPPEGFIREDSFFGTAAACESVGRNGIAEGKWSAYICVQVDPFTPFRDLYVKK